MTTNTSLVTSRQTHLLAESFIDTIANSHSYIFLGDYVPRDELDDIVTSSLADDIAPRRNMIAGKLIQPDDLSLMIRNIPYESNKVFDMWDDQDEEIASKDFYCIVDDNSYYHVFKCLDNNMGANSTIEPDFGHIVGANTILYQTADGYRWKYMYSVDETTADKFKSLTYFPLVSNSTVETQATAGSIDIIKIEVAGKKYDNYVEGTFSLGDISINGNNHLFLIANSGASSVNGFYQNCLLYISTGSGAGEYRVVTDYISNGNGNFVVLDEVLTDVANDSRYQIYPRVVIRGDGTETIQSVARALVNATASNSIFRVEILDPGKDYKFISTYVAANDVVGVTQNSSLRWIRSPLLGHGYDAAQELFSKTVCLHTKFQNTESNTIIWENGFQQIGILKDPLFANVKINTVGISSAFLVGEKISKINPLRIGSASINTTSNALTFSNANFYYAIQANTYLWISDSSNTESQFVLVNAVTNSTSIQLSSNGNFTDSDAFVYVANPTHHAYHLSQIDDQNFMVQNVMSDFSIDDLLIGETTGTIATVNTVIRNDITKGFSTFVALNKYKGTLLGGTFQENETIYHIYSNGMIANASLHSVIINGPNIEIWCSNQVGQFEIGTSNGIIYGTNSSASALLSNAYSSELVYGTGEILYLENINKIERSNNQNETIQIYLEF